MTLQEYKASEWATKFRTHRNDEDALDYLNCVWHEGPYAPKPGSREYKRRNPIPLGKLGLSFCLKAKPEIIL